MSADRLEPELNALGIDPKGAAVLALLPMIYVAWADGRMEAVERQRIVGIAETDLFLDERTTRVLRAWLHTPPTPEYFARGLLLFRKLASAPDSPEMTWQDLRKSVVRAESVARASSGGTDSPWTMKTAEWKACQDVAGALGVDASQSWARMLRDLGEAPGSTLRGSEAPRPDQRAPDATARRGGSDDEAAAARTASRRLRAALRTGNADPNDPSGGLV